MGTHMERVPKRTTRDGIMHKVAVAGAGWDDQGQRFKHSFNSLPLRGPSASFNNGEGLAVWLRRSAGGAVAWKRNEYRFCPEPEIPARMAAAKAGDVEQLLEMLDRDSVARLEDKDKLGRTVLHAAAAAGQIAVVRMLAARCAGWPSGFEEETPPATAGEVSAEQQEVLRTRSAVQNASSKADLEDAKAEEVRLKKLLQTDGVVTAQTIADFFSDQNAGFIRKSAPGSKMRAKSPHFARWAVTPEPVKTVGDRGYGSRCVNELLVPPEAWSTLLNTRDRMGNAALHLAASDGHAQVVDELIYRGAEVETRNLAGRTALHCASMNGHLQIIFMLCSVGASARCRDREGRRPVDMTNDEAVVQFLRALVSKEVAVRGGPTVIC
jgi:ankyrin repeat protein